MSFVNVTDTLPKVKGLPVGLEDKLHRRKQSYLQHDSEWRKARVEYLNAKIRYEALLDMALNCNLQKCSGLSKISPELVISSSVWTRVVLDRLLQTHDNSIEQSRKTASLDQTIVSAIKETMMTMLIGQSKNLLANWTLAESTGMNDYLHVKQLPVMISSDVEALKWHDLQTRHNVKKLKQETERKDIIRNHVGVVREIMTKHTLSNVATLNRLQVEHTSAKLKALELKLKYIELEVMAMTYTPDAVKALDKIKRQYGDAIDKVTKEISYLRGELDRYQAVGPQFESLVEEHSKLRSEIESKKWALQELKLTG